MRLSTYVGVIVNDSLKFVTDIDRSNALWEAGKDAKKLSEDFAKDIVEGLTFNGFRACIVKMPSKAIIRNKE